MRDIAGFVATRKTILEARPTFRVSWITYAAACYLNSDYISAAETITTCAKTITEAIEPYEQSEMLLFLNLCLEKQNKFTEAIDHLKSNESSIVDKLSYSTKLAELYQLSGNYEEAKKAWLELVVSQPQNYRYHCGMQAAYLELPREISEKMLALKRLNLPSTVLDLSAEQQKLLYTVYEEQKFKSKLIEKIELTILTGEKFKTTLDSYLRKCLAEGMPALYHDVCDLVRKADINSSGEKVLVKDPTEFKNHKVVGVVLEILDSYIANLKTSSSFDGVSEAKKESPQTLLWALFLKCHMKEMSGELLEALTIIDECIEHTPTALDMITKKAKIEKKIGNYLDAAITMDDCRVLDLQDRYLNNKATKYFLLADEVQLGMNTIAMFTKHDGDSQKILYDLQCNWYELELADSYCRKKQWGQALKQFYAVRKHFYDYYDDLFDFHGFCMRKVCYFVIAALHDYR